MNTGPGGYRAVFADDAAPGTRYWYRVNGDLRPIPRHAINRRTVRRSQVSMPDATPEIGSVRRRLDARTGDLRDTCRHVHAGRDWASAATKLPLLARTGITMVDDARRRVSRPPAGDTMVCSVCADALSTGHPTISVRSSTPLTNWPGSHPRRGLQPPRSGRVRVRELLPRLFRTLERMGEGLNFDGPESGPVREFFSSNAATGSTNTGSMACVSMPRKPCTTNR